MKRQSGQTAVMMALSLTALFGLVGFTVDVGASYYTKQKAQAAAESAAMASAAYAKANGVTCNTNGITCNSTLTSCSSITSTSSPVLYAGCLYANQNGFPMSAISMAAQLSATTAPPCSPCTSPAYWIQAKVATTHNNLFLEVAQSATDNINAQAFAGIIGSTGSTGSTGGTGSTVPADCIWVLDNTSGDTQTFFVSGASVSLTNCSAQVNSATNQSGTINGWQPTNEAANANGGSTLTPNSAYKVVGGAASGQNYCPSPGPFTCGAATVADPLATLPALNEMTQFGTTACTQSSTYSPTGGTLSTPVAIASGIYCGGINLSSGYYTFQTGGVFEMRGSNSTLSISNGTTTGTNVMFYFTTTTPSSTANPGFSINTSNVTLSAPSTGTYKGILFFGNPAGKKVPQGGNPYSQFAAGASPNITGTIYLPTGYLLFTGGSGSNNGRIALDVWGLQINGASSFTWDSTGNYTGLATYGSTGSTGTTTTYSSSLIE